MAKDGAKKIHAANQDRLRLFLLITVALNVVYLLYRAYLHRTSFGFLHGVGWLLLLGGEGAALHALRAHAAPEYDGPTGRLASCNDLTALEGTPSSIQDVLWVSWFVQTTTLFSDWFWLFYLAIPCYGIYILYTNVAAPLLASFFSSWKTPE